MLIYGHVMLDSQREALKGMDDLLNESDAGDVPEADC